MQGILADRLAKDLQLRMPLVLEAFDQDEIARGDTRRSSPARVTSASSTIRPSAPQRRADDTSSERLRAVFVRVLAS
jgi:hypothetical protein